VPGPLGGRKTLSTQRLAYATSACRSKKRRIDVSRGCGPVQRRILDVLLEYEGWAVETTELKRLASPDADRSNLRRTVRGLLRRGMIHEWSDEGRRTTNSTFWAG
jgi:hypothetical protein